jgi:hypothetical protein
MRYTRRNLVRQVEYIGEVLDDGHLSLPDEVREKLELKPTSLVQVVLAVPEANDADVEEAWNVFRDMGQSATKGKLDHPSEQHDQHLYKRDE